MSRGRRILVAAGLSVAVLAVAVVLAGLLVLRSGWLSEKVRQRLVAEVERASGGEVQIGALSFDWRNLNAEVENFVLRGTEPRDQPPLFSARRIAVGIKVVSLLARDIDVRFVTVDQPRVRIVADAAGRTNIPGPKPARETGRGPVEQILRLAIGRIALHDGWFQFDSRKIPLDLVAEDFDGRLDYDSTGPRYRGGLTVGRVEMEAPPLRRVALGADLTVSLLANRVEVERGRFVLGESTMSVSGALEDLKQFRGAFSFDGRLLVRDAKQAIDIPVVEPRGSLDVRGALRFGGPVPYEMDATVAGTGLAVRRDGIRIENARLKTGVRLAPSGLELADLALDALGGRFRGRMSLAGFRDLRLAGTAAGFSLEQLAMVGAGRKVAWNGSLSGPVELEGVVRGGFSGARLRASMTLTPAPGPNPVQGTINVSYSQASGSLDVQQSHLETGATSVDLSGVLGRRLVIKARTRNLDDLMPALAMAVAKPPALPAQLKNGFVAFQGEVAGPLDDPEIRGRLEASGLYVQGRLIDSAAADFELDKSQLHLLAFQVRQNGASVTGKGDLGLTNWKVTDASRLSASASLDKADLQKLTAQAGLTTPVAGLLSARLTAQGTAGSPQARAEIQINGLSAYGEKFDRLQASAAYTGGSLEIASANILLGKARLSVKGAYNHPAGDWSNGVAGFELESRGLTLSGFEHVRQAAEGVDGAIELRANGSLRVEKGAPRVTRLDGKLHITRLRYEKRPIGDLVLDAGTRGDRLDVNASAQLRGAKVKGAAQWSLAGDYPGLGRLEFSPVAFSTLQELLRPGQELPFDGVVQGEASFSGSFGKADSLQGSVRLTSLEFRPKADNGALDPALTRGLVLRNNGPVLMSFDGKGLTIQSAQFAGRETSLQLAGTVALRGRVPWNLDVKGDLNLALVRDFAPDLVTAGRAQVNATVRGALRQPQITGRMILSDASVYYRDFTNGIDKANGVILFDRNRATVEKLTAQVGGGDLKLSGFVGFGSGESIYRLQADAARVRVRYPEGVSTTVDTSLSLTGTATRSLLSGTVTIVRLGFTPRTDVGGLLAQTVKPIATPAAPSEILQNMQLDVHVETSPNAQFQTAVAQGLQAEADLRLRGFVAKPIVLGRISVNQGEIQFFGNKYNINRGDISFYNPARIEPILDMNLETVVRAITVNINFSGPLSKLNMTYRSDPPLQSQEIIALLAVGRAPGSNPTLASSQAVSNQNLFQTGANTLLGQALATPVSSRLQRFFGVSRLKIDPQLTGLDTTPQARLTIEQQISRDITLTVVTNLAKTQQQLVRLEWNLSREWSVIAVRDENGIFGIDFLYKKRFR